MKFLTYSITLVVTSFIFLSCSKETDTEDNPPQSIPADLVDVIQGRWEISKLEQKGLILKGATPTARFTGAGRDFTGEINFTNIGKVYSSLGYKVTRNYDYTIGTSQTRNFNYSPVNTSGTYSLVSGEQLNTSNGLIGASSEPTTFDVTEVTTNSMKWHATFSEQDGDRNDILSVFVTFKKK